MVAIEFDPLGGAGGTSRLFYFTLVYPLIVDSCTSDGKAGLELVTDVGGGATFTAGDETMHDFDGDENGDNSADSN